MDKPKKKKQPHEINIRYISNYEPKFPSIRAALRTIEPELENDDLLRKMFPKGLKNMQVSYRRKGKNIKEMLATAKINEPNRRDMSSEGKQTSCGKNCAYCDLMNDTTGNTFTSNQTKSTHRLRQIVDCESRWVVYMVTCKRCKMQGVGSTNNLKKRIAIYKSTITNKCQGKCGIDHHFLQDDHGWTDFQIQIIVKMNNEPQSGHKNEKDKAFKLLRKFEGYWQTQLATIEPNGMTTISEFHRNRFGQSKPAFNG